jgi:CheY-like chemotaxis protein
MGASLILVPMAEPSGDRKPANPRRALVVDDEAGIRRLVRRALEGRGFVVDEAQDGAEALRRFRANPADLVVTDLYMPGTDGLEFTRAVGREFAGTKVIAMSGGVLQATGEALSIARLLGASDTLAKPFTVADLLAAVDRVFGEVRS